MLTLVFLFVVMVHAMHVADPVPNRSAPDLTVIGHQWWWEIRYSGGAVTANEIHVPTGSDVLVGIGSVDVIHSFWVPQLGRKIEAIPGHPNQLWIRADAPGEYLGTCSEFCGAQHAWMRLLVVAQPPAEYRAWLAAETARIPPSETAPAQRGETLFQQQRLCGLPCGRRQRRRPPAGPDPDPFRGSPDHRRRRGANTPGRSAPLAGPPSKLKPGSHMPDFNLTPPQLDDLVAYLETLK